MSDAVLERAVCGDARAFGELTEPYRGELRLHCYRMLGSLDDAEDLLQETLIAAWRGLPGFTGRASLRTWLYRIATNRCLNALRDRRRRTPPEPVPPFEPPPPTARDGARWLQPCPDLLLEHLADRSPGPDARYQAREAVELAFVGGLACLPPRQAAVLLLRDVLGYAADEVAAMLVTSPAAVKGLLQRARAALGAARRDPGRAAAARPGSARERELVRRFAEAFTADDVDGLVALLTDDAWLAMPPAPHRYRGRDAIGGFLLAGAAWRASRRFRLVPTAANTQPAFGCYLTDPDGELARPAGLIVLTVAADGITDVTRFLDEGLHRRFGLPATVPALA